MKKQQFVKAACENAGSATAREKAYWEKQHSMYNSGIRNGSMHDYTLVNLSKSNQKKFGGLNE